MGENGETKTGLMVFDRQRPQKSEMQKDKLDYDSRWTETKTHTLEKKTNANPSAEFRRL